MDCQFTCNYVIDISIRSVSAEGDVQLPVSNDLDNFILLFDYKKLSTSG